MRSIKDYLKANFYCGKKFLVNGDDETIYTISEIPQHRKHILSDEEYVWVSWDDDDYGVQYSIDNVLENFKLSFWVLL